MTAPPSTSRQKPRHAAFWGHDVADGDVTVERCSTEMNGEEKKAVIAVLEAEHPSAEEACKATYDTVLDVPEATGLLRGRSQHRDPGRTILGALWAVLGDAGGVQVPQAGRVVEDGHQARVRAGEAHPGHVHEETLPEPRMRASMARALLRHGVRRARCTCTMTWSARGGPGNEQEWDWPGPREGRAFSCLCRYCQPVISHRDRSVYVPRDVPVDASRSILVQVPAVQDHPDSR